MDQAIKIAKLAALWFLVVFLIVLSVAVVDAQKAVRAIEVDIKGVTDKAGVTLTTLNGSTATVSSHLVKTLDAAASLETQAKTTLYGLNSSIDRTFDNINRPCEVPGKPCGTLADVNRTLATFRGAAGQVEVGAMDQRKYFETDLPPLMNSIKVDVDGFGATEKAAETLIADPNLKRILANSADMTTDGKQIVNDARVQADRLTYPKPEAWYRRVGHFALGTGKLLYDFYFR